MALPVSLGIVIIFTTLYLLGLFRLPRYILPLFSALSSVVLWYAAVLIRTRARFFFGAVFTLLSAALLFLLDSKILVLSPSAGWPFIMLFVGAAFMVSGYLGYNRLHVNYIIPALAFTALGFVFLLFSTDIVRVSLISVVLWWFPVLFLPFLTALILWLFRRPRVTKE